MRVWVSNPSGTTRRFFEGELVSATGPNLGIKLDNGVVLWVPPERVTPVPEPKRGLRKWLG